MNAKELRQKSETELKNELMSLLREQFNLRMQQASGQMPKGHLIRDARRNIARIKTVLNEKKAG